MAITTLDLLNSRVDLSDVLSWRVASTPRFISLFRTPRVSDSDLFGNAGLSCAFATEHKWLEGIETPKTKVVLEYEYSNGLGNFTVPDAFGWQVGDLFHICGEVAVLRVETVSGATLGASLAAANGSTFTLEGYSAPSETLLAFDSRPIQEGSTSGEDFFAQSRVESNYTQIFRGDVSLSGTAQAVAAAGMENVLSVQLQHATDAIVRRINSALIYGVRVQRSASSPGTLGGLYYFGTQSGGLSRTYADEALTLNKLNLAAQDVSDAGCVPDTIVCGSGQAQVISSLTASQIHIPQGSTTSGNYVETFVTSAGGHVLRVVVEPSLPSGDVWVCDTRGLALVPLQGRALHTEPASTPGMDGARAILLGEYTAEFKNARQAFCRISGLKKAEDVLA